MRRRTIYVRMLPVALCVLPYAFGYIGETITTSGGQTVQITRPDASSLQFYLNSGVVAGATSTLPGTVSPIFTASSNPTLAVEAAMASWNSIGSANIHFNALSSTITGHNSSDCLNVISVAASAADLSVLGYVSPTSPGVVAVTANAYIMGAGSVCGGTVSVPAGAIIDSDILINPYVSFSTDSTSGTEDVQAVITHEFGHVLGMNHSGLLGTTMYPYAEKHERHQTWDEKAFAATYYPSGTKSLGTISGTVTLGAAPVANGLITLVDFSGGQKTIGTITSATGTYTVQVPAGTYGVYAEPFNSFMGPTNVYSLTGATGTLTAATSTTAFEPTFSGGNTTPLTTYTVTPGSTSTANISVTAGATTLTPPFFGIGKAGGNGDITSFSSIGGATSLTAGQSYDIALSGTGIDSTIAVNFIGTNVTLVGSPRVDTSGATVNGLPIIRQTLQIGSQTNVAMGSLWISKGANILPLSGFLDMEPMTPTVNSVSDAESARTSFTSGQWAAIYGTNLSNGSGSWNANTDFTGGTCSGCPLPSNLGGVSVTVNGSPASVYYVSPTQINFLTPSGLPTSGTVNVVASNFGTASPPFNISVGQASPSFFYYPGGRAVSSSPCWSGSPWPGWGPCCSPAGWPLPWAGPHTRPGGWPRASGRCASGPRDRKRWPRSRVDQRAGVGAGAQRGPRARLPALHLPRAAAPP